MVAGAPTISELKQKMKAVWMTGDFGNFLAHSRTWLAFKGPAVPNTGKRMVLGGFTSAPNAFGEETELRR
jgi:hypothetical protein